MNSGEGLPRHLIGREGSCSQEMEHGHLWETVEGNN